ncbi:MAG: hypothetical protein NVS2B7_11170 [Herpetosiphon sp.]
MKLVRRDNDGFAHAAVDVNAQCLEVLATVGFTPTTGAAPAAVQVGFDGTVVADMQRGFGFDRPKGDNLA